MQEFEFLTVRFTKADKQLLRRVCENRREDLSDFARRAIMAELGRLNYLASDEKKSLGVQGK